MYRHIEMSRSAGGLKIGGSVAVIYRILLNQRAFIVRFW
jgi:hypothetical protein